MYFSRNRPDRRSNTHEQRKHAGLSLRTSTTGRVPALWSPRVDPLSGLPEVIVNALPSYDSPITPPEPQYPLALVQRFVFGLLAWIHDCLPSIPDHYWGHRIVPALWIPREQCPHVGHIVRLRHIGHSNSLPISPQCVGCSPLGPWYSWPDRSG
jgi:hypothetical protein